MARVPGFIWLDGALAPAGAPHLPVSDRGFQLGDGIFETLRARRGVAIELDAHLARLHQSADALALRLPFGDEAITEGIVGLLAAESLDADGRDGAPPGDAALRITVSRGTVAGRGLLPAGYAEATGRLVIEAWPYAPPAPRLLAEGARAITSTIRHARRSPLAGVKTTSRAEHVYARLEALRAGADEALFLTADGEVSESTIANVWAVVGARLLTPSAGAAILAGTTRAWLFAHAAELGFAAEERPLVVEALVGAGEAFLSSSVAGIVPLVVLDGRPIGSGQPGQRSLALREARERWIDDVSLGRAG